MTFRHALLLVGCSVALQAQSDSVQLPEVTVYSPRVANQSPVATFAMPVSALRFEPEVEHLIYCGLPHNLPSYRGQLQVPAGFIGGSKSSYVRRSDLSHMRRYFGIQLRKVEGGHLFPFEQPAMAADEVKQMIARLLNR